MNDKLLPKELQEGILVLPAETEIGKDMEYLVNKFKEHLPNKRLGVHTHNNMQLAFSNTLVAADLGVELLDASVYGMGRAAGNCPTELLVTHLKGTKYELRPVLFGDILSDEAAMLTGSIGMLSSASGMVL